MEFPYLTDEEKRLLRDKGELNGCGGKGGFINPPDFMFEASCDWHDFNYWKGGTEYDRMNYDIGFYKAMLRDALRSPLFTKVIHILLATTYYFSVRLFGKKFFHYGEKRTRKDIYE